jgi:hypothetical protein
MACSSSTARDLLHGALLLVERQWQRFLNELDVGTVTTTAPRRRDDDDDVVSLLGVRRLGFHPAAGSSRGLASTRRRRWHGSYSYTLVASSSASRATSSYGEHGLDLGLIGLDDIFYF